MRVVVERGRPVDAVVEVAGDKSIAHRWLLLAATARGRSELGGVPPALDVISTARFCAALLPDGVRGPLEVWASNPRAARQEHGSTANDPRPRAMPVVVEARGRHGLEAPAQELECGNSGTTMRLGAGILASAEFRSTLTGDASLSRRPMERVAEPLRRLGAGVETTDGHAPVTIEGRALTGIEHHVVVPSAQVKSAVLLAGLDADGETVVREDVQTRDHTERALSALGAPVAIGAGSIRVSRFQHEGFAAHVPGDASSAAFLVVAAALAGVRLEIRGVGLNPTRLAYLEVLSRMGVRTERNVEREELGEPVGALSVSPCDEPKGTTVSAEELPLVIDEVPVLAIAAAFARGPSRFDGAGELRVKESDRLGGVVDVIRGLGGDADVEGEDLVVAGGELDGGSVASRGDHRLAMSAAVAGVLAPRPVTVEGAEAADVSFPGFYGALRSIGAEVRP